MTTWTFKGLAAGAICLALAGCSEFGGSTFGAGNGDAVDGLTSATLARGAVALVPPPGYCIDSRSLRASFALMARCDTLGGTTTFGTPLALITATAVRATGRASDLGATGEDILSQRQFEDLILLEVKGTPPSAGMRDVFWRAIAPVGDQVLGLAIYEAQGGSGLGERAPDLLAQAMRRTQAQTAQIAATAQDNSATTRAKPTIK